MGLLDRIITPVIERYLSRKADVGRTPPFFLDDAAARTYNLPDLMTVENQAALIARLGWVQIAVTAVSQAAASVPFRVQRRIGEDTEDIINHEFELLLDRPNPLMSRFELLEATVAFRRLTGNAYWYLNKPSEGAPPVEVWVVPPSMMQPIPDGRSYIAGYRFRSTSGQYYELPEWSVVHFKRFHPLNPFVGLSPIESIAMEVKGDLAQAEWHTNFFAKQNAKIPGALSFADPVPNGQWAQMQADIEKKFGGTQRSGLLMLRGTGQGGVTYTQMGVSQRDMEFLNARNFTKEQIFNIFAPGLSSMLAVNATEANSKTGKATLLEMAVYPELVAIAEKISSKILGLYGSDLVGEFEDVRLSDRAMDLQEQVQAAKVMTIEEMRATYYRLPPLGDERDNKLADGGYAPGEGPGPLLPQLRGGAPVSARDTTEDTTEDTEEDAENDDDAQIAGQKAARHVRVVEVEPTREQRLRDELRTWERWAKNRLKSGGRWREFETVHVPAALRGAIEGQLEAAHTPEDVTLVFADALAWEGYP